MINFKIILTIILLILTFSFFSCGVQYTGSPVKEVCTGFYGGVKEFTDSEWEHQSEKNKKYYKCSFDVFVDGKLISKSNLPIDENGKRKAEAEKELKQKYKELKQKYQDAIEKAQYICNSELECNKAFALTQIYISDNSDMKIQVATDAIIETYNPSDSLKIGFKALKVPGIGHSATIKLNAYCGEADSEAELKLCMITIIIILNNFTEYINSQLN
jgi:hypothetical protein